MRVGKVNEKELDFVSSAISACPNITSLDLEFERDTYSEEVDTYI